MAKCLHRDKFLLSHVNLNGYSPKYAANWKENNQSLNIAELIRPPEGLELAEGDATESDQSVVLEGDMAGLAENELSIEARDENERPEQEFRRLRSGKILR